jgi:CRISPR/Cas system CSM-associated protein Csm3 (group 7 of RAMP superfamily)
VTIEATMTEENRAVVLKGLGTIIRIMEAGAMTLGSSRTRGHGRVQGTAWRLNRFELADPSALADWLLFEEPPDLCEDIIAAFPAYSSARSTEARIQMDLTLVDDLLVRDGLPSARGQIDTGQMLAAHGGKTVPVIPGASIAGAFRMRARRILELLCTDADLRAKIVRSVFGSEPGEGAGEARGSRVAFREAVLEGGVRDLVQTRLAIDRFTGGAFPGALFDELPVFGAGSARTKIVLTLSDCEDAEVGLLLLVCRDLATGDLPLGGTTSIGRGRFRGENIALEIGEVAHALDLSGESSEGEAEGQHYVDAFLNLIGAGV